MICLVPNTWRMYVNAHGNGIKRLHLFWPSAILLMQSYYVNSNDHQKSTELNVLRIALNFKD